MAVTHAVAVRNAITDLVTTRINAGAAPGQLIFQTAADIEVATLAFAYPAFPAASGGTAAASPIVPDSSATGGTIAKARIKDSNNNDVLACSVTATGGGGDIQLNSVLITAGQQVSLTNLTYTSPP